MFKVLVSAAMLSTLVACAPSITKEERYANWRGDCSANYGSQNARDVCLMQKELLHARELEARNSAMMDLGRSMQQQQAERDRLRYQAPAPAPAPSQYRVLPAGNGFIIQGY